MAEPKPLKWFLGVLLLVGLAACSSPVLTPEEDGFAPTRLETIPYTIQVGAFSTTWRAARYAEKLNTYGIDAYYFIDADGLAKVRFERFQTKDDALQRAEALKIRGQIDAFYIVQPVSGPAHADPIGMLRSGIVSTARRFIGTPYRWGGASAKAGFDCSGLTMTVYRLNGLELPRNSRSQFDAGVHIARSAVEPGDLVFFATGRKGRVSHVGIYTGNGQFIHASGTGKRIRTDSLAKHYFRTRYMGARRYF